MADFTRQVVDDVIAFAKSPGSTSAGGDQASADRDRDGVMGDGSCLRCGTAGSSKAALSRCGKCKVARYCCRECQVVDWASHKAACKAARAVAADTEAAKKREAKVISQVRSELGLAPLPKSGQAPPAAPFFDESGKPSVVDVAKAKYDHQVRGRCLRRVRDDWQKRGPDFCEWWAGLDRDSQRKLLMRATQDTMPEDFKYTKDEIDALHAAVRDVNRASLFEFNVTELLDQQCKCASGRRSPYAWLGFDIDIGLGLILTVCSAGRVRYGQPACQHARSYRYSSPRLPVSPPPRLPVSVSLGRVAMLIGTSSAMLMFVHTFRNFGVAMVIRHGDNNSNFLCWVHRFATVGPDELYDRMHRDTHKFLQMGILPKLYPEGTMAIPSLGQVLTVKDINKVRGRGGLQKTGFTGCWVVKWGIWEMFG